MFDKGMERRQFLKTAAIAGAAVAGAGVLAGCASKAEGSDYSWSKEADVVVVGGGGTGLAAAAEAADAGASVLVIEKSGVVGGSTAISAGVIQASGTSFQKKFTKYQDDTPEKHAMSWITEGEGEVDEALVRDLAEGMPGHIEWLVGLGLDYSFVYGHNHVPYLDKTDYFADRIHMPAGGTGFFGDGQLQTGAIKAKCDELGVEFQMESEVTGLVYEQGKGVLGVRVGEDLIKAKKAVVIATAGIDRGEDLALALCPPMYWDIKHGVLQCYPHNTGDGIRMALAIGAAPMVGGVIDYDGLAFQGVGNSRPQAPCLYVNGQAQRFVCEDATYGYMNRAIIQQSKMHNAPCHMIMDADGVLLTQAFSTPEIVAEKVKDGLLLTADTIEGLAAAIGVSAENLKSTLAHWNAMIAKEAKDVDYERKDGLVPIAKAPFYAMKLVPHNLGSIGGLKIDVECKVLDLAGEPIPHLFAGGLCTGGWIGPYYPGSGTAIAGTVHWGRKCGKNAAAETAWA